MMLPVLLLLLPMESIGAVGLESGELIPSGAADGRGPLAAYSITSEPVGACCVFDNGEPDLFVATGRHSRNKGLFVYEFSGRGERGEPVFKNPRRVDYPIERDYPPAGHIIETDDGAIHGLWLWRGRVVHTILDKQRLTFEKRNTIRLKGLPRGARSLAALFNPDGSVELLLEVGDVTRYRQPGPSWRSPDYTPYNGRGMWRGGLPYVGMYAVTLPAVFEGPAADARLISKTEREVRFQYGRLAVVDLGEGRHRDVLTGSRLGPFHYYRNLSATGVKLAPKVHAVNEQGIARRHPTIHPTPIAYPNPDTGLSDLIVGGEGGLYWYRVTGRFDDEDKPFFDAPVPVLEEDAALYAGSLPVTNCVDWDGDGDKDIIAGNSEGFILFFENRGDNSAPRFLPGVRLEAGGREIHVQPGYRLDIQGPAEARWGYVCPTVVDWNQDGLLDIVMSDSTARHTVFINEGSPGSPRLAPGEPLYYDGLDMHGMWRVQPAAGLMDGRMAYITLDKDDELHLYWQVDPRNLTDGFKLRSTWSKTMRGNGIDAGGTGRLKLVLTDWDLDGVKDLIVGTPRHGSIPSTWNGMPKILGLRGAAVLFLKNVGSESEPLFAYPKIFTYKGKALYFGGHSCGPAPADFGQANGPGLIIGEEEGRFFYFDRDDLALYSPDLRTLASCGGALTASTTALAVSMITPPAGGIEKLAVLIVSQL